MKTELFFGIFGTISLAIIGIRTINSWRRSRPSFTASIFKTDDSGKIDDNDYEYINQKCNLGNI